LDIHPAQSHISKPDSAVNLAIELALAVPRGQILAAVQPQFDLSTGRIVAVELLARWRHPDLGLIAPDVFIPLAETHGHISEIGDFMIDEGCRLAAQWSTPDLPLEVAVNVSASQLSIPAFFDHLEQALNHHRVPAQNLVLEITESLPVAAPADVAARLTSVPLLGLGVSVDDYGTGFSSLDRLDALPATEVKLDRSLIQEQTRDVSLLENVIRVAGQHGLRVVAEGIETLQQLDFARTIGCDRAQGYFLGRPVGEAEMTLALAVVDGSMWSRRFDDRLIKH
jgi:EAL domain-containing protein (putative c-di-GMP-specific phosphodiesterase class I)